METKLTIQERLKDLRVEKGWTLEQLEQETGISRSALGNYEQNDVKDIGHNAIIKLAETYGVSADYLLGMTENREMINAPLRRLHLNDEMIKLLEEEKINARLLCEMAAHEGFQKLMTDIEIYIDGIGAQQIRQINQYVDLKKEEFIQAHQHDIDKDRNEFTVDTLSSCQLDEDEFFLYRINQDMAVIVKDLKRSHPKDDSSGLEKDVARAIITALNNANSIPGSDYDKFAQVFLNLMQIDFESLTDVEYAAQIEIIKKFRLLNTQRNLRGRSKASVMPSDKRKNRHGKSKKKKRK